MTSDEYRQAIAALGLSQMAAATFLEIGERTSRRWASGEVEIPAAVAMLLILMVRRGLSPARVRRMMESRNG